MAASYQQDLDKLGIPETDLALLSVLPLVGVAWADGAVQEAEAELIQKIVSKRKLVATSAGETVLAGWLKKAPSDYYLHEGNKLLAKLIFDGEVPDLTKEIVAWAEGVADAAGGVFGWFGRVETAEKQAIEKIARTLSVRDGKTWEQVRGELE